MPEVTVVTPTHNRSGRLVRLLDALRAQTLPAERFEVVVVDDASSDDTQEVLAAQAARGDLRLRVIRQEQAQGAAAARNEGWRAAESAVVAFTDDDCRPAPEWLEAGLRAGARERIVQGRVEYDPEERHLLGPFSRALGVDHLDGWYATANIFYPRAIIEQVGGFDPEGFPRVCEDTDLAWRSIEAGAAATYTDEAIVRHCVIEVGPRGRWDFATRYEDLPATVARHPAIREAALTKRYFWKPTHYHLIRFLLALPLGRRIWPLTAFFLYRYLQLQRWRATEFGDGKGGGYGMVPFYVVEDAIEVVTMARGSLKHGALVL
jgi:glycosyltransferase involved in cell wall biosynthesis